jgi:hypothetical protein
VSTTALAAFLKPVIGPVMIFVGLLLTRWIAILVRRALPESRVKVALFDRGLLDRKPWAVGLAAIATIVALGFYLVSLDLYS